MTRRYTKYTKESLEPIVQRCLSFRQVLFELGLKQTGGSNSNIRKRVEEFEISTDHFLGRACNKGKRSPVRKSAEEFLVLGCESDPKIKVNKIKRSLDEIGRKRVCVLCGIGEEWNGKKLVLQVDHINANNWDNREENLRYLCPNCHSQTETFGNPKKKRACGETGNTQ